MKYLFYFISFIFPALCSSAQPAERDSSIYIASSRLYRMGESLVVSMQVDITRQIPSNESVILIPRLSDSLDNFIQLPAIYVNGRKQHIFFQRETGMSYQQWRQQWRQMRAMELLSTGRNIGYCAFELGFASDSAFIAFFKDMAGVTPGSWLK